MIRYTEIQISEYSIAILFNITTKLFGIFVLSIINAKQHKNITHLRYGFINQYNFLTIFDINGIINLIWIFWLQNQTKTQFLLFVNIPKQTIEQFKIRNRSLTVGIIQLPMSTFVPDMNIIMICG